MIKILYLEDDINLSNTITEFLEENDFLVVSVYNSTQALKKLYEKSFDLLILDVNLPDINGFELLKQLRASNINLPTIFTTTLDDIDSLDEGYSVGADDYIRKPFLLKELLHRINALIKRNYHIHNDILNIDENISFDIKSNILIKNKEKIQLNQKELQLLKLLLQYKNSVVEFETIYEFVWNTSEFNSEASLRTYIKNLRKIIGKDKIINIKKQGYKLVV